MKITPKKITPAIATEYMKRNTRNRNMSQSRVSQFAADMKSGAWILSHQGIAFDEDGTLVDGQHRLQAIIDSGVTVEMLVVTGLQRQHKNGIVMDIMDAIDRGGLRSIGQQLQLAHGYANGARFAAAAKAIADICNGSPVASVSTAQTLKVLGIYQQDIAVISGLSWPKLFKRSCVIGTLAFGLQSYREPTLEFATKLASMDNVPQKSPVHAFYRWNMNQSGVGSGSMRMVICKALASCLVRFIDGKPGEKVGLSEEAIDRLRAAQKSNVRKVCEIIGA